MYTSWEKKKKKPYFFRHKTNGTKKFVYPAWKSRVNGLQNKQSKIRLQIDCWVFSILFCFVCQRKMANTANYIVQL